MIPSDEVQLCYLNMPDYMPTFNSSTALFWEQNLVITSFLLPMASNTCPDLEFN